MRILSLLRIALVIRGCQPLDAHPCGAQALLPRCGAVPMTHHALAHVDPLSGGDGLRILDDSPVGIASHHESHAQLVHLPRILSVQITTIDHDGAAVSARPQMTLGLLSEREQPASLILLDLHHLPGSRQACLHIDEHQLFPARDSVFLDDPFLLPFPLDFACLLELATPLIALWRRSCAAIEGCKPLPIQPSPPDDTMHHSIEETLHQFPAPFPDIVRQALRRERPLFFLCRPLRISAFGYALFHVPRIDTY
ncbi:MAG TPA: hypothetical protein VGF67_07935 [Ktedonobacteraceae bacterium]